MSCVPSIIDGASIPGVGTRMKPETSMTATKVGQLPGIAYLPNAKRNSTYEELYQVVSTPQQYNNK
jgi:hypothetical protein